MAIPLRQGRTFTDADRLVARACSSDQPNGGAECFFRAATRSGRDQIWRPRRIRKNEGEIVGMVGDVHHFGVDAPIPPTFYVPLAQSGVSGATVVIRAQGLLVLGQPARKLVQSIDRDALVGEPVPLDALVSGSLGAATLLHDAAGCLRRVGFGLSGNWTVWSHFVFSGAEDARDRCPGWRWVPLENRCCTMIMGQGLRFAALGLAMGQLMAMILTRALKGLLVV